jgi:predicted dehydrogenase
LKIVVVGYGSIGKRHVQNLLKIPNTEIIICTKQKNEISSTKIKIFNSLSECINEKPDVGIITNESSFHVQTAILLANAGIDLFIEKPLSNSLKDCKELLKIIKKKKLITQIGCQLRFHKCIKKIKEVIVKKKLGKIISIKVECGSYLPDWHPHEDYKKSYAAKNELGGGVVLTNIHEIDYMYWFLGKVKEVISITGNYSDLKISADDFSTGILKFDNGVIGEFHLDYFQKPEYRYCKIIGTEGTMTWDSEINEVKIFKNKKNKWFKVYKWNNYDRNLMFKEEIFHFLKCVKKREKTINPIEKDGIKTIEIALSIIKSSKIKKWVKI